MKSLLLYLKPKVTWVLESGILNVFDSYQSSINYSYDSWISCFYCHKRNHNALIIEARGQNILFQNASLLDVLL